jgi:hypothetical protein
MRIHPNKGVNNEGYFDSDNVPFLFHFSPNNVEQNWNIKM